MKNNLNALINGARTITRSIADKYILDKFLRDFSPILDELMRTKKYLYVDCDGTRWVHIFDSSEQLNKTLSAQNSCIEENDDAVEEICKEISYNEFLEMTNGEHMDFEKYCKLDGDLIYDF